MLEIFHKQTVCPTINEARGSVVADISGSNIPVVTNLPTGHAKRLDILLRQTATGGGNGVTAIKLRTYAGGQEFSHTVQIHGAFTAATHAVVVEAPYSTATIEYAIGDSIDILIDNGNQSNTVTVYVIARS